MCFTINVNIVREEIEKRFGATFSEPRRYEPSYYQNAFALPLLPVVASHDPGHIHLYRWGLIPSWVRDEEAAARIRKGTFNARAESIDTKPSFRESVRNRRCLVPARGFFEWQDRGGARIPYYIYLREQRIFSFAGIYDQWIHPATGESTTGLSVITTVANPMMEKIHNTKKRMPVILGEQEERSWIDPGVPLEEALRLLDPYPETDMQAHTISGLISRRDAEKNVPELIEPHSYEERDLFS